MRRTPSPWARGALRPGPSDTSPEPTAPASAAALQGAAALESALRDLGSQVRRGTPPRTPLPPRPTGLSALDRLLGGGFPRGALSEVVGPVSSGRTSLALALLAQTTARGEVAAVVDLADAFDPPSAEGMGVVLERVLWVRAPAWKEALRSVHQLVRAGGFGVVLLDRAHAGDERGSPSAHPPARIWPRLRRELSATDTSLVLLGERRVAQAFADLALEMDPLRARFHRGAGLAGAFLEALEGEATLVRSRLGSEGRASTCWPVRVSPIGAGGGGAVSAA